ncbi:hypothetical protein V1291_003053 [Nitrobacteraceae bacterium AZCC 1564]
MIRYALRCERGHDFESWFQSSSAYDSQRKRGLVACPMCDSTKVEKAIMAPRIASKGKAKAQPAAAPAGEESASLVMAPQERELIAKLKELRDHVLKNADNVGSKFPDEARKMHYGDIEHRAIYGEATAEEAKALVDEGIEVAPLPVLPDDRN